MGKCKIKKFSLTTIKDLLSKSDLDAVRLCLSSVVGLAVLKVSGKVKKCAKREGVCRLVIEPGDVPGIVVFADCISDAATVEAQNIHKGADRSNEVDVFSIGAVNFICLLVSLPYQIYKRD